MDLKAVFFFLFSISLIHSFSVSMTPFPISMTAGMTYDSQLTITTLGQTWTTFYLHLGGVNASNEIEASLDGGACDYSSQTWTCTYNQSIKGVYTPKMRMKLNELLNPMGNYSYQLEYRATEDVITPTSTTSTSYSSSGGSSFAPRSPYYQPKNTTQPIPTPPAQNTTTNTNISVVPPNQTTEPAAQNDTQNETPQITEPLVIPIIQPIELIEPTEKEDYLLPAIGIGLFVVSLVAYGVYSMTRNKED